MLEIGKKAVSLNESDLLELTRIVTDADERAPRVPQEGYLRPRRPQSTRQAEVTS